MTDSPFYSAFVELVPSAKGFEKSLNKELSGPSSAAGTTAGNNAGMGFVGAFGKAIPIIGGVLAAAGIGDIIGNAIEDASTYQQAQGAVESVFGQLGSDAIEAFAEGGAKSVGQSMNDILGSASLIGVFGKAAGLAGDDLVDFSTDIITLGADLAAFGNTSPEEAVEALTAGLRGESEPLRKYGVLLDDATLKARAMEMGIYDGNGPLTQQQRILAAYGEIMAQTTDQQGQFAAESDTLAGKQAVMAASWENISTKIGTAFLPIAEDLSDWFLEKGIPALEDFATWLNSPETQEGFTAFGGFIQETGNFLRDYFIVPLTDTWGMVTGFAQFLNGELTFEEFKAKMTELPGFWGMLSRASNDAGTAVGTTVGGMIFDVVNFANEVGRNVAVAVAWFQDLPRKIGVAFYGAASWLFSAGQDVIRGLINGITSMVDGVIGAITDTVGGAVDWAKDLLGIASPSKVFTEIGQFTSQGFARGIESEYGAVRTATRGMTSAAVDASSGSIDGGRISGLLEIGGDGLARIIDGRFQMRTAEQNRIDNAGRRPRFA